MKSDSSPDTPATAGKPEMEKREKYLLRTSRKIVPLLKAMAKKTDLVTARVPVGGYTVMTAVLDILPARNLIILDYGPDESLNKKLLAADQIVCTARHNFVETCFNCSGIKRVKYKGEPAFAAPIPDSVLHLERREYFRIKPLISHPAYISLTDENEQLFKLRIFDIGVKGLSMQDWEPRLKLSADEHYENCKLTLPANPSVTVNLEIRYTSSGSTENGDAAVRAGCRFINLNQNDELTLQRFINMVQLEQNAMVKG